VCVCVRACVRVSVCVYVRAQMQDDYPIALEGGESAWIGAAGGSAIHPLGCWAGRDKIDNSVC